MARKRRKRVGSARRESGKTVWGALGTKAWESASEREKVKKRGGGLKVGGLILKGSENKMDFDKEAAGADLY